MLRPLVVGVNSHFAQGPTVHCVAQPRIAAAISRSRLRVARATHTA
jgi:hypothetical protein